MEKEIVCAGSETALAVVKDELHILCMQSQAVFPIFQQSFDKQIKKIVPASVVLSTYNEAGTRLVVVTATGLMAFFCFDVTEGHRFTVDDSSLTVIYKTMRVISSHGRILPMRVALEDQYMYNARTCPYSENAFILVPFDIVLGDFAAVVRVQPPDCQSCLVRVVFDAMDIDLDNLPTRQAFLSPDWQFIYSQGILHMSLHKNVLCLLTHVAMVECWLLDHDPCPLPTPLPLDRVNLKLRDDAYMAFADTYRSYVQQPFEWKEGKSQVPFLIPPEWEVLYSTHRNARARVQETLFERNKLRPSLGKPLSEVWAVDIEECDETLRQNLVFSDTAAAVACPWKHLVPFRHGIYLLSMDGLYLYTKKNGWKAVMDQSTNLSIYATDIAVSTAHFYVVVQDNPNWLAYNHSGETQPMPVIPASARIFAVQENNGLRSFVTSNGHYE